ncbi:hypothetical protein SPRG_18614 [Saprolegnia parasitica CBS 223.65]|uniref:Uncharacterized protein n=1 Tax=Saprolegnia parasitica (strain CBS 223.65) TaxID=695850 RepID=A0A067BBW5_SAPPC|nr:hypothetical protein SPRG_18614 [Saprolegnia parasitica CBS 223.65]KDO15849.1 hypothetical protein SPRG_18614 [Saprolegnia parasitica CBS 223.65]|eukprot:XP_012213442.1 hypothetical protein SPRG_18614 [Saprolegnia parasitica CBS 223.65]
MDMVDATMERLHALKLTSDMALSRKGQELHDQAAALHVREQYENMVVEQTKRSQLALQENAQLRSMLATMEQQNQVLRQTVHALEEYREKHDVQVMHIQQLQDEIKRLQQANFSLKFYLQQSDHTIHGAFPPQPPDVY